MFQLGRLEQAFKNSLGVFLAGGRLADVDEVKPRHVRLVGDPSAAHDDRSEGKGGLHRKLRLLFRGGGVVVVDGLLQHAGNTKQMLRDVRQRAGRFFGLGEDLGCDLAAVLNLLRLVIMHRVGRDVEKVCGVLDGFGDVAAMLIIGPEFKGVEGVGAVERIGSVVAVGPAVVKENNSGKFALAVGRQIAAARCWAVAIAHKQLVHVVGIVEGINDAGALAGRARLAGRLEFLGRSPRTNLLKLGAEAIPLSPEKKKRRRDFGQAIKDAWTGPGVGIASVRVDRRRQHVLHGPSAQFKHHLCAAGITLHRPANLVRLETFRRAKKNLATIRAADNLRRGGNDCIIINAQCLKDQARVRHVVHIKGAGAGRAMQQAHVVRRVGGKIRISLCRVRDCALRLLPAERRWTLCACRHGNQKPAKF